MWKVILSSWRGLPPAGISRIAMVAPSHPSCSWGLPEIWCSLHWVNATTQLLMQASATSLLMLVRSQPPMHPARLPAIHPPNFLYYWYQTMTSFLIRSLGSGQFSERSDSFGGDLVTRTGRPCDRFKSSLAATHVILTTQVILFELKACLLTALGSNLVLAWVSWPLSSTWTRRTSSQQHSLYMHIYVQAKAPCNQNLTGHICDHSQSCRHQCLKSRMQDL